MDIQKIKLLPPGMAMRDGCLVVSARCLLSCVPEDLVEDGDDDDDHNSVSFPTVRIILTEITQRYHSNSHTKRRDKIARGPRPQAIGRENFLQQRLQSAPSHDSTHRIAL